MGICVVHVLAVYSNVQFALQVSNYFCLQEWEWPTLFLFHGELDARTYTIEVIQEPTIHLTSLQYAKRIIYITLQIHYDLQHASHTMELVMEVLCIQSKPVASHFYQGNGLSYPTAGLLSTKN